MRSVGHLAWAVSVAACVACGSAPRKDPAPLSITPNQATAEAPVDVVIDGDNFLASVSIDFRDRRQSRVDGTFRAVLLGEVKEEELDRVTLRATGELGARVPADIPRGVYDLRVVDPADRAGTLKEAYRVVTSGEHVNEFRFEVIGPQRVGVPFTVILTAVDAAGRVVDGFADTVALADRTGTADPPTLPAPGKVWTLGRLRDQVMVMQLTAATALTVTFVDSQGTSRKGTSNDFEVRPSIPVALGFVSSPVTVVAGTCSPKVEVEARGTIGQRAPVEADTRVTLAAGPAARLGFFADSACTASVGEVTVAKDADRAGFHFRAEAAGTVRIAASADGLVSATQDEAVDPAAPARVVFDSAAQSIKVGACSAPAVLEVHDAFDNPSRATAAVDVTLTVSPTSGMEMFSDAACTTPATSVAIAAAVLKASFHFRGTATGSFSIRAAPAAASGLSGDIQIEAVTP